MTGPPSREYSIPSLSAGVGAKGCSRVLPAEQRFDRAQVLPVLCRSCGGGAHTLFPSLCSLNAQDPLQPYCSPVDEEAGGLPPVCLHWRLAPTER